MADATRSSNTGEPGRALLRAVHREFVRTGEWPFAWRLERQLENVLDAADGLASVCAALGDVIVCGPVTEPESRVKLRLKAFPLVEGGDVEISAFLALCRFAADAYRNSDTHPVQITLAEFIASSGTDEALSRRAFELAYLDGHFWASGSPTGFQLNHFARQLARVDTIEQFEALWTAYWRRHYRPTGWDDNPAPVVRPGARYFLSHAASDANVAQYIANLIRAADKSVTVFVASTPGHIQTGDDWLASIRSELKGADAYIVLLSERSVLRPWIWFETGAAWFSERRLIPLILPGLSKSDVPLPLGAHQILSLESEREIEQFFADLKLATPNPGGIVAGVRALTSIGITADGPPPHD